MAFAFEEIVELSIVIYVDVRAYVVNFCTFQFVVGGGIAELVDFTTDET